MAHTFKLKQTIGSNYRVDPDDNLETKRVLNKMGLYDVPDYGMTSFTDDAMFEGIKLFQRTNGLTVDGIMHPGGETEKAMGRSSNRPTPGECKKARQELQRLETELQQLQRQLAAARETGPESWIKKLETRIYWTKIGIRGAKNTIAKCDAA